MKQEKHFKRTAFPLSAKSMVSLMLLIIAMLMPQGAWAGACAYTPGCASIEDMQVHLNGTNGNYNGSANNEVVASLKFNYWLDIFNYDGDNGYWDRDLTMKIDGQTLTFYSDYACTTKVSTDYSTVLQGVWGVFGDSNEDHTIGKNKSGSGNKAYFKTSGGLTGYINIYNYYAASNKWTTMKVEVFIYDLYGHKVSVCGTYKRSGKSDIAYDYVFYLGGCPRPTNVGITRDTSKKQVNFFWDKQTYSIPSSDLTGETRVKAWDVIDNGRWGVYRDNYSTLIKEITLTMFTSATDAGATCSDSPYTYYVCYEPEATYANNGTRLKGSETSQRGLVGSSSITLNHVWGNSGSEKDPATCTTAAVHYQTCIYCSRTSDANHTYTSGSALGHGSTGYNESYSWTGNAYNDASKDTKACIFTLTCKKCSTKVVNGASLTCTKTAHVDATCTATGSTTYQATGSYTSSNSAYNYSATKTNDYTVAALGHGTTGYTESYSWTGNAYNDASQDTKACTFTLTCKKCSTKVVNGASLTCTKTAHVDALCTATGSTTYQATGSYTAANSAYNYSATKTNVYTIAALGHSYGAGAWSWGNDGHSATCTRTCSHDANHTSSKSVTLGNGITSELTEAATCSKKGSHTYTATTTVENVEYSDSKEVADIDIDPLNHNYGAGVWSWNNDGHSATCTRTCSYDANHTSSASVTLGNGIESVKLSDPTCGVQGTTRYTAMTTVEGVQYSDTKDVDDIAATGLHTFNEETDPHHTLCTVCDHSFFRYTSSTGKAVDPWDANALKDAYDAKLDFTNTYVDGQGVMEFNGTLKTIGTTAFSYCLDFIGDLTIPNSVTSIGSSAFQGCEGFTGALTIPNSVTSIEKQAFARCSNLTGNLTIPNSVTSIGISAFAVCSNLTGNLTIPNSVTSIGWEAFTSCSGFTGIEFQSVPQIGRDAFNKVNCPKTVVLSDDSYVYTGENPDFPTVASVKAPCTLDLTGSVVENHANLTRTHTFAANDLTHDVCTVCNHGFFRYTSTENKVVVPNPNQMRGSDTKALTVISNNNGVIEYDRPLVTIGLQAFRTATNKEYLTGDLVIPGTVKSIGQEAFAQCNNVNGTIVLPPSLNKIGNTAFYDCNPKRIEMHSIPQLESESFYNLKCTMTAVLSDDSYVYTGENPYFPEVQSATYTRRGIKNQWGTIVVPFMVNGRGDDYDLYTLSSVSEFELTLTKVNGTLAAGTPALIRLHDDLDGDYDLTLTAANTAVSGQLAEGSEADGYQLVGTYETTELSADDYFMSNNKFWSVGDMVYNGAIGVKTAPFRAYLKSTWAGVKARRNAPASPTELKRLDADGNGVIETADIDLMVASMLNGENDYSIGDVVRAIDNAGTSVAVATEMLEKGVKGDPDEPERDEYGWITIE